MYYVYAIKSIEKNYVYVGISDNPARRIKQHNKGYNKKTKPYCPYCPFKLILLEKYSDRKTARTKEKYYKS